MAGEWMHFLNLIPKITEEVKNWIPFSNKI